MKDEKNESLDFILPYDISHVILYYNWGPDFDALKIYKNALKKKDHLWPKNTKNLVLKNI